MPHLSPMFWTLTFVTSWLLILLVSSLFNSYKHNSYPKFNKELKSLPKYQWKW